MYGSDYDPGPGVFVFGVGPKEVGAVYDLGLHGQFLYYRLPMVFLGVFLGI